MTRHLRFLKNIEILAISMVTFQLKMDKISSHIVDAI